MIAAKHEYLLAGNGIESTSFICNICVQVGPTLHQVKCILGTLFVHLLQSARFFGELVTDLSDIDRLKLTQKKKNPIHWVGADDRCVWARPYLEQRVWIWSFAANVNEQVPVLKWKRVQMWIGCGIDHRRSNRAFAYRFFSLYFHVCGEFQKTEFMRGNGSSLPCRLRWWMSCINITRYSCCWLATSVRLLREWLDATRE